MPQLMSASQAKSSCQGAQMPADVAAAIEAAGLDWTSIWTLMSGLATQIPWAKLWPALMQAIQIEFGAGTPQQKMLAIIALVTSLFLPAPIPVPIPGPVAPITP